MVKAFVLYTPSDAYGVSLSKVVFEDDMESGIKSLLILDKKEKREKFEYFLFDSFQIKLHLGDKYIEFEFQDGAIFKSNLEIYFKKFCKKYSIGQKWTYLEFKEYINELKIYLHDKGLGDDPFCSFYFRFLELDVDPSTEEWLEFVRNAEDDIDEYENYKVVKENEKQIPDDDCDDNYFGIDGKLHYFWHIKIRIPKDDNQS